MNSTVASSTQSNMSSDQSKKLKINISTSNIEIVEFLQTHGHDTEMCGTRCVSFGYSAKSMVLGNIFLCVVCACQKRRDPEVKCKLTYM